MAKSFSRRVTRGRIRTASGFLGRDRAGPGPLRSPSWFSALSQSLEVPEIFEGTESLPDDRRTFYPTQPSGLWVRERAKRPAMRFSGRPARVVQGSPRKRDQEPSRALPDMFWGALSFRTPQRVAVCVQRGRRREVIHALGIAGSRVRKPRYGPFSKVRC